MNYYNEFDPAAAQWLRELIADGLIPDGFVDERSIADVQPGDLAGYDQCHFFAGIGGWSRAFFIAGIAGKKGRWTGSCPCQPFSDAGKGLGTADPRHLWPHFFRLIRECRPAVVYGEQVASKAALAWLDGVFDDLEAEGYACAAADFSSASVGAPHIRQRLYWVAYGDGQRFAVGSKQNGGSHESRECPSRRTDLGGSGGTCRLADAADSDGRSGEHREEAGVGPHGERGWGSAGGGADGRLEQPDSLGSPAGVSGPIAGHEGLAGVADDAGDQTSTRERERDEPHGWCTPSARDWKDTPSMKTTGTNPDGSSRNRVDQLPRQAQLASGAPATSSNAPTASRGALNPRFSLWLMGYPDEWASCGERAMQSIRSRRRSSSKPAKNL